MIPRRDGQPWNDAERQSLAVAVADLSLRWCDIGELLGRTGHACQMEATKQGWMPRRKSAPREKIAPVRLTADYVAELRRRGISQETINMMERK
jgi:hypothetical protein